MEEALPIVVTDYQELDQLPKITDHEVTVLASGLRYRCKRGSWLYIDRSFDVACERPIRDARPQFDEKKTN